MYKRYQATLMAAVLLFGLATDGLASEVIVTDYSGRIVKLDKPAQRILALSPHAVENVFSAGAGDKLIGVVAYSNYPEQAGQIAQVGSNNKLNMEAIVGLQPDLIIAWQSGNVQSHLDQLRELGFTIYIDEPAQLSDIARSIRDIGTLAGSQEAADQQANDFLRELAQLSSEFGADAGNSEALSVFYQIWDQPLQTLNGQHLVSAAIELCGGKNIFATEKVIAPIVNIESVLALDPQVILASGMADNRPVWLDQWLQWPDLQAVANDHLFFVHPDHVQRHTVRILKGIRSICDDLQAVRSAHRE